MGNIGIWYLATLGLLIYSTLLVFYLLRRQRNIFDLDQEDWTKFQLIGEIFLFGYLCHYLPYFFVERTLFLHHYLSAFMFKTLLFAATLEHLYVVCHKVDRMRFASNILLLGTIVILLSVIYLFKKFSVLSYGNVELSTSDILALRWKDTWDFIVHKN